MKYILVKNARTDPSIHTRKLASGEILHASQDYYECYKIIPFLMDSPEYRLSFCRTAWKFELNTAEESISLFNDFIKEQNKNGDNSDLANLSFADKNFNLMEYPGYYFYCNNLNWSMQLIYDHYLYVLNKLSDQAPYSILNWLEMERLIGKDLAERVLPEFHKLLKNISYEDSTIALEANEKEHIRAEIANLSDLLNKEPVTEATIDEYFKPFNDAGSDYQYLDDPNKNGVFDFDYSYEEMCNDLGISESYSIFIDFSDPDELFDELKSEIKMGIHKVYWIENFISEIMDRLVALPEDARDNICLENDFDRFYNGILTLADLNEQEEEWVMEDILK